MIQNSIRDLVRYGLATGLVEPEDTIYTMNRLLELFGLEEPEDAETPITADKEEEPLLAEKLEGILKDMLDYAAEKGLLENDSVVYRDLFDTKIMSVLVARPSEIIRKFRECYAVSPEAATEYFYKFSQDTDYIRRYRVCKDQKWVTPTPYGDLDITINLSKPEKDPKAIAAAKNAKQSGYPKCQLCMENEGYAGRVNHPARQNHRIIPITINGGQWGFQYSPYVYYNHFQGGHYEFPMAKAAVDTDFTVKGYEDVRAGIVNWPMSVIRLAGPDSDRLISLADVILEKWRGYTDEAAFIYAETNGEPHNTITPIARKRGGNYELDLVLRNNITTEEHPFGVYHPHAKLHHIKKENIGLIEVMGLAVLPSRLDGEMADLEKAILDGADIRSDEVLGKHADWVEEFLPQYKEVNAGNIHEIIQKEIGKVFMEVLEDAGVYKRTEEGRKAFGRFVESLN